MAEGHSFHLANNVILMAYSWAYDKFKQALDRVHRMNSVKPVNVYVVLCTGSIDRRLESLVQEKSDAAELVLDGRLIGERTEEVNLAELLKVARREFNEKDSTLDEGLLQAQWPALRQRLGSAMRQWIDLPAADVQVIPVNPCSSRSPGPSLISSPSARPPCFPPTCAASPSVTIQSPGRHDPLETLTVNTAARPVPAVPPPPPPAPTSASHTALAATGEGTRLSRLQSRCVGLALKSMDSNDTPEWQALHRERMRRRKPSRSTTCRFRAGAAFGLTVSAA